MEISTNRVHEERVAASDLIRTGNSGAISVVLIVVEERVGGGHHVGIGS